MVSSCTARCAFSLSSKPRSKMSLACAMIVNGTPLKALAYIAICVGVCAKWTCRWLQASARSRRPRRAPISHW
jgi:hypothetical protein